MPPIRTLLGPLLAIVLAGPAAAITISADLDTGDCFSSVTDDCVGGLYTLDVVSTGTDTYLATITADYSGLYDLDVGVGDVFVSHIEIKVATDYLDPITASSGIAADGPLNGGGCNGNNDGFICVPLDPEELIAVSMSWTIDFGATSLLADEDWHLGMRFTWTKNGRDKSALLSAYAPIPEPTAALLFAIGLGVVHEGVRRRR